MTLSGSQASEDHGYPGESGDYRWKPKAENGEIIADSAEGYRRKRCDTKGEEGCSNAELVIED
jgi:uncharacterized protein YegP (UPF0339 family)